MIWSGSKGSRGVLQPRGEYLPAKNNARRHPALSYGGAFLGRGRGGLASQERPSERLRATPRRLADKPADLTGRLTLGCRTPQTKAPRDGRASWVSCWRACRALPEDSEPTTPRPSRIIGCTARRTRMKKPRQGAGLSSLRGLAEMRVNGKPTDTISQKAPPGRG